MNMPYVVITGNKQRPAESDRTYMWSPHQVSAQTSDPTRAIEVTTVLASREQCWGAQLARDAGRDCTAVHLVAPAKSCCFCNTRLILKFMTTDVQMERGELFSTTSATLNNTHP